MFTEFTWQDWQNSGYDTASPQAKAKGIMQVIARYKSSEEFIRGLDANLYFKGESPVIGKKSILKAKVVTV